MAKILASAATPATMGEWVQGWIGGGEALVSLVVAWRGTVELCAPDGDCAGSIAGEKAVRAFERAKRMFSDGGNASPMPGDSFLNVKNPLPPTRGLATSTMDIAGTFAACVAYAGVALPEETLFSLCAEIEPSDGIMFSGLALVDHINGRLIERLPGPPDMTVVALVPARTMDTADYRRDPATLKAVRANSNEHELAYDMLRRGLLDGDATMVARAATHSARTQQKILPKEEWDATEEIAARSGAIGIAAAHSGTALGLLYAPSNKFGAGLAENMLKSAYGTPSRASVMRTSVCGGGVCAERA